MWWQKRNTLLDCENAISHLHGQTSTYFLHLWCFFKVYSIGHVHQFNCTTSSSATSFNNLSPDVMIYYAIKCKCFLLRFQSHLRLQNNLLFKSSSLLMDGYYTVLLTFHLLFSVRPKESKVGVLPVILLGFYQTCNILLYASHKTKYIFDPVNCLKVILFNACMPHTLQQDNY